MNDGNNKKIQIKIKQKHYFFHYWFFLSLILNITLVESMIINNLRKLKAFNSEIHIINQSTESESAILGEFIPAASEILVNGVKNTKTPFVDFAEGIIILYSNLIKILIHIVEFLILFVV